MKNLTGNQKKNEERRLDDYEAPAIVVLEVEIEQGFQVSAPSRPTEPSW